MFAFSAPRRSRKPSLTPMIDVVFLLLVFFMLASQFGQDAAVRLSGAGNGTAYAGPPRLIQIAPETLTLNGGPVTLDALPQALEPLMTQPGDTIILRGSDAANLQRLLDVVQVLQKAGFDSLVVVE